MQTTRDTVNVAGLPISRFIIGGNPFSGFSHQSPQLDREMREHYTPEMICRTLARAEELGVTAFIGRTDEHICGVLEQYRSQGGQIQWIAQTAPELACPADAIELAVRNGAKACFVHGGVMDKMLAEGRMAEAADLLSMIHDAGLAAGVAGHNPAVHLYADEHLDLDFHMCCYYNPTDRSANAGHVHGAEEKFRDEDRQAMVSVIAGLGRPVFHYKILAAGRNDAPEAFAFAAAHMRDDDAVCVGVHTKDQPDMIEQDIRLLTEALASRRPPRP